MSKVRLLRNDLADQLDTMPLDEFVEHLNPSQRGTLNWMKAVVLDQMVEDEIDQQQPDKE